MRQPWYCNAVVYEVDTAMFRDADGDGTGDLRGLIDNLHYIRGLGATCLWLMPFYLSPFRDGGYDVSDHLRVDPRFGDVSDFVALLEKAEELDMRIIVDLVMQHTSDQHRWFQEARADRSSPFRDFYVWADEPQQTGVKQVFPGVEDGVWTWDEQAQQFYRHAFYSYEPDLNLANPRVREEMRRIVAFWLRLGVAGFRLDALPFMIECAAAADPTDDGFWLLRELAEFVSARDADAILLTEANIPVENYDKYLLAGSHGNVMMLDFWTNQNIYLSFAREDARELAKALEEHPTPTLGARYANWLRNHDELDLEWLQEEERHDVMEMFAPSPQMAVYGRGIRRRLAPILGGDRHRIEMAYALLFSLPGTPVLFYGDEIGMGEDLSRSQRRAVRSPMQWSADRNAGFSSAADDALIAPIVSQGPYGYKSVNAYDQYGRGDSLLAAVRKLSSARGGAGEIGLGECKVLDLDCPQVLALQHTHKESTLVTMVNVSSGEAEIVLPSEEFGELVDSFTHETISGTGRLVLPPYGYRWLRPRAQLFF